MLDHVPLHALSRSLIYVVVIQYSCVVVVVNLQAIHAGVHEAEQTTGRPLAVAVANAVQTRRRVLALGRAAHVHAAGAVDAHARVVERAGHAGASRPPVARYVVYLYGVERLAREVGRTARLVVALAAEHVDVRVVEHTRAKVEAAHAHTAQRAPLAAAATRTRSV